MPESSGTRYALLDRRAAAVRRREDRRLAPLREATAAAEAEIDRLPAGEGPSAPPPDARVGQLVAFRFDKDSYKVGLLESVADDHSTFRVRGLDGVSYTMFENSLLVPVLEPEQGDEVVFYDERSETQVKRGRVEGFRRDRLLVRGDRLLYAVDKGRIWHV